ncbi:MAG: DUF5012 domain-containing protein [Candidatus Azobacteroides sp.]|nr:DUF5012 domain-containing protein [Candidatus Azobacteroides sp.]
MKNYFKITVLFLGLLFSTSACHDITTDNVTSVTYYVTFELEGGEEYLLPVGEPYIEPGAKAFENGVDVSSKMVVDGSVNSDEVGFYYITYSAVNVDGFPNSATRKVIVYDPTVETDISGSYTVNLDESNRYQFSNGAIIKYSDLGGLYGGDFSNFTVDIKQILPGIFQVSDFYGGYYVAGRNYAKSYLMGGYIALNDDNSLSLLESLVPGWGDSLDDLVDGSYDPDTNTIEWGAEYAGSYSFNVVLNKN